MNCLVEQQEEAEKTLNFLKQQLQILNQLAVQKKRDAELAEIKRLEKENNILEDGILKLKQDLKFYEVQNGVKQIPLPKKVNTVADASSSTNPDKDQKNTASVTEQKTRNKEESKNDKKAKDENSKDGAKPECTTVVGSTDGKPIDVSRLNMRVGKIIDVKKHPDADSLYVETVDVAEDKPRTIVSGLVKHITLEQMQDRMAIFLLNLKPAKMRGILSEGMIMCASSPEKVEILEVPKDAAIGDRVVCQDFPGEPDVQLNPKKKIWEQVAPDMKVDVNGQPEYKGSVLTIPGKGDCSAPSMKSCQIK